MMGKVEVGEIFTISEWMKKNMRLKYWRFFRWMERIRTEAVEFGK